MSFGVATHKLNRMDSSVLKNQTLIQGQINNTIPLRKIRIIVSDPYATESSSNEDDHRRPAKNSSPKPRRIVHEIFLPNGDAGEKSSMEGSGEMSETILKRFRGARRRKSGKWTAEIRDPFLKRRVFLGTFGTGEDASRVFEAKKVDFRERQEAQSSIDSARHGCGSATDSSSQSFLFNDDAGEKSSGEGSGGTIRSGLKRFRGVRRRKSGSWSAEIGDPFKRRKVFLGVFGTAEEASRAYEAKKVEFRKRQEAQSAADPARPGWGSGTDSLSQCFLPSDDSGKKLSTEYSDEMIRTDLNRFRGVRRRKSGKWTAEIRDPFTKWKVHLGTFGKAEEASRVFEAKKVEFRERQEAQSAMDSARPGTDSSSHSKEQIEAGMILGSILIDNNGFLLGEFSNLDDDLTISD